MLKPFIIILLFLVAILGATAIYFFRSQAGTSIVTPPFLSKISIGGGFPTAPEAFVMHIIKKYGFDAKRGINIDYINTSNPAENQRKFQEGELDMAWTPILSAAKYFVDGRDVRIIGPMENSFAVYVVKPESPFKTFVDLRGAKYGTLPKVTATYNLSVLLMRELGFDLVNDFKLVFGTIPELIAFLDKGEVDSATLMVDMSLKLVGQGKVREIASQNELWKIANGRNLPMIAILTTQTWMDKHEGLAQKVVAAHSDAVDYIKKHPEVWEQEKAIWGITTDQELATLQNRYAGFVTETSWNAKDIENIKYVFTKAVENGMLPAFNMDSIFILP